MASEYLKWKYKDVQPDAPLVLTKKQKLRNWWHYHKWHVILGAVLLVTALSILRYALGIGMTKPDYQIAYVGAAPLPEDTVAAVQNAVASLAEDQNGDGKVVVQLNQYPTDSNEEGADAAVYASASSVRLMGDLETRQSCLFILEDYETFQEMYGVLADSTGAIAASKEAVAAYRWSSCPAPGALDLGEYTDQILGQTVSGSNADLLNDLYLARYGGEYETAEAYDALWSALTKGAVT